MYIAKDFGVAMEIARPVYLDRLIKRRENGMAKVLTGIRRCGKSYLLHRLYGDWLRAQGVAPDHIVSIQLDDIENIALRDPRALYQHIRETTVEQGTYYVFLDEIQYVEGFSDVINGLMHRPNMDVYVTGSNSKFLSSDILTEFRGRGDEIRVRPLAFSEYLPAHGGSPDAAWRDYFTFGGMPLVLSQPDDEMKVDYLNTLFNKVYLTDICERNDVRHSEALDQLVDILASADGSLTNPSKIASTFQSRKKADISDKTVKRYIEFLLDAFMIEETKRYDIKGRKYIGALAKYYYEDVGLRNARLNFRQQEENHIMENVIYNELRFRGWHVDVGVIDVRERKGGASESMRFEIDFVANKGSERVYLQSAFRMPDLEKEHQEKRSLRLVDDSFKKMVIVRDSIRPWRDESGVITMGLLDFLLDPNSLD